MLVPLELVLVSLGVLGLLVGSFLNVVIWRVPRGESIVSPPSACPNCHHRLRAYDNIPVVSWLLLRGKCRDCGSRDGGVLPQQVAHSEPGEWAPALITEQRFRGGGVDVVLGR